MIFATQLHLNTYQLSSITHEFHVCIQNTVISHIKNSKILTNCSLTHEKSFSSKIFQTRTRFRHSGLAYLEIRLRNEEVINSTRNMIYSLKDFYFLLYRRRYWFSTLVSDNQKYLCDSRLYVCINTRKFKDLDSREITSLLDIEKVIYMRRHFNHRRK